MNFKMQGLENVRLRIAKACKNAGREFGENQLQEALSKQAELADLDIEWHFIGSIQSNKTRDIAARFDWVQSVDRVKILKRLSAQRPEKLEPINICLQVNIDAEPQKSGLLPDEVEEVAMLADSLPGIRLRGLMTIPRATDDAKQAADSFHRTRVLYDELRRSHPTMDTLSMGMSSDLEIAIAEGSTMVRVGSDLFGPRP